MGLLVSSLPHPTHLVFVVAYVAFQSEVFLDQHGRNLPNSIPNERSRVLLLSVGLEIENIGLHTKPRYERFHGCGKGRCSWEPDGENVHDPLTL
jgi:hypothetical protein